MSSITVGEIFKALREEMPVELALDWDNVGLLAGSYEKEVKKIMTVLDLTSELLQEAVENKVDLIVSHHPMLMSSINRVNDGDFIGRRLVKLLNNDISYIAMHTNYDIAAGCMGDLAAGLIGIKGAPLKITERINAGNTEVCLGIGKVGELDREYTLEEFITKLKNAFDLKSVGVYGSSLLKDGIRTAAVSPGSGRGMYKLAKAAGAQLLITGDVGHHEGVDAKEEGVAIIDAGHYGIEHIFIEDMKRRLLHINENFEILTEKIKLPENFY